MKKILLLTFTFAALCACSKDVQTQSPFRGVIMTSEDFGQETRTTLSPTLSFAWAKGDIIGVVPMDGKTFQTNYEIKELGSNPKTASFDGGAWALKEGESYAAYYPCQRVILKSNGAAQISFAGQSQNGNDNREHLGSYDYMYASAVVAESGMTTFAFMHKISILKITLPVQKSSSFTRLVLSCDSDVFAQNASISIADGNVAAESLSSSLAVELSDISLSAGENLIVWAAVLPTADVSGKKFRATLTSFDDSESEFVFSSGVSAFEAGKYYNMVGEADGSIVFKDDFSWLGPFIASYNAANATKPVGKTVEDSNSSANAPNIYKEAPFTSNEFKAAFAEKGYTDLNPSEQLIYVQDQYLKFSRTQGHNTALKLSLANYLNGTENLSLSFDFCMMCQGSGIVDAGPVVVIIDGDGTFGNGTKVSEEFVSKQEESQYLWNNASTTIAGATAGTNLIFVNGRVLNGDGTFNWSVSGAGRFFLDNILITR